MGGALKSVFGGSGGIFGAVLGVASMFFPPLAIAGSMSNLLTSALGEAVKMAASTLVKEFAMPKFLEGMIGQMVDKVVSNLTSQNPTNPEVDAHVQQEAGGALNQFKNDFAQQLVAQVVKNVKENTQEKDSSTGSSSSTSTRKTSGGSWLEAIAIAMGEVAGEKAAHMVDLSNQMSQLSHDGNSKADALLAKYGGDVSKMDDKTYSKYSSEKSSNDQKNAQEMTRISSEIQGTGQMLGTLQNAFSNTIKTIGEALSSMARKG